MMTKKRTDSEIQADRTSTIMNLVDERCGYYRCNPQRAAIELLNYPLKLFQQIVLWLMFKCDNGVITATRGIGKTLMIAIFGVLRCWLYPGTKIVCCSATYKQAREIILKITDDLMLRSPLLRTEITKWSTGQNDSFVMFKNGSWIRAYVANDNSRGARSNILLIDESRMIDQDLIDKVFRPMNASPRQPAYLNKPEYAGLQEMNKELYTSSAWYRASELFEKVKAYTANFLDPNLNYFICDFPYQLSIKEGLLMRQQIANEMSEATFNEVAFFMERIGLFWGASDDALFDYKVVNRQRVIQDALRPLDYYQQTNHRVPDKQKGEVRLLSVDVALMATRKHNNDASALMIHSAVPAAGNAYFDNLVYIETAEGLRTEELGLMVMRFYYQYKCDYIALDRNGVGLAVLDYIMADRYDPLYGQIYPALNVIDNPELAERCKVRNAPKVIYAIQANSKTNSEMALALRAGFQNGYINLLAPDSNIEEVLSKIRGYSSLSEGMQVKLRMPYVQTTLLIEELINLQHDISNGLVKVRERSGMRKDRYSSLEYGYAVIQELARKKRPVEDENKLINQMIIRPAKSVKTFGKKKGGW